jgi:lipoprotein-releasing system ATP-binding protein
VPDGTAFRRDFGEHSHHSGSKGAARRDSGGYATVKWTVQMTETSPTAAPPATRIERETGLRTPDSEEFLSEPIIRIHGLEKTYKTARGSLIIFRDLDLEVAAGELVAVVGQSGAGKSTLLHILGALDAPSAGTVYCASTDVAKLTSRQAAAFRNREIGFVWQFHYLLPEFTAQENVAMPLLAGGRGRREAMEVAGKWLGEVGLEDRRDHRPGELSGGEQQRLALARALVNNPRLLLADEPTGDLDETTARQMIELIERIHGNHGLTSVLVTHNTELAARCSRVLRLERGRLTSDSSPQGNLSPEFGSGKSSVTGTNLVS